MVPSVGFEPTEATGLNRVAVPICISHEGVYLSGGRLRTRNVPGFEPSPLFSKQVRGPPHLIFQCYFAPKSQERNSCFPCKRGSFLASRFVKCQRLLVATNSSIVSAVNPMSCIFPLCSSLPALQMQYPRHSPIWLITSPVSSQYSHDWCFMLS